jgi:hypothetical protein
MNGASTQYVAFMKMGLLPVIFIVAFIFLNSPNLSPAAIEAAPDQSVSGLPVVSFTSASSTVSEGTTPALITVQVSPAPTTSTVTVEYFTQGGSAQAGTDYVSATGSLTFVVSGSTQQNISITILNDALPEPTETLNLFLQNPTNATIGTPNTFILSIIDNDTTTNTPTGTPMGTLTSTPTRTPTGTLLTDQYEPNNTFTDATEISAGQEFCNLTLWPVGDQDFFTFFAKAGFTYRIFTDNLSPGLDTVLTVYNPQGNVIATNDDFQGNKRSQVDITADSSGFYFARIINQDLSDPANKRFCFEITELPPPAPTSTPTARPGLAGGDSCEWNSIIEYACLIGVDAAKTGLNFVPTLGSPQDTDMFRLWVKAGIGYTCETLNLSAYADTNMILLDQNGNPFNPWIGNDDREDPVDPPDFSSKVTYLASYTGWLYIMVGPVNVPEYEEASLQTYDLLCSASVSTATPTPTATFRPLPPGGTFLPGTPQATPTLFAFPTFPPTVTPFMLPTSTPTPTPPVVQFQPLPTATPLSGGGQDITINVTLYYDVNNSFTPELTEGIQNVAVFLFDSATGDLLLFGTTNETGTIRFTLTMVSGPLRVVVPFLNYNQIIVGGSTDLLLRIAPQPLPIGIP